MPSRSKISRVLDEQNRFLMLSVKEDQAALLEAIEELERRILRMAQRRLEVDGAEKLLGPKVNLKQAQQLHEELVREFESKYGKAAKSVVKGYTEVAEEILSSWSDLGIAAKYTGLDRDMMDTLRTSYYDEFMKFGKAAEQTMVRAMYDAVAGQSGFDALEQAISAALTGKLAKNGRPMSTYAGMFANDATMNFHNSVTLKKAADAGMDVFIYYGNVMATTRPFCSERVMKKFTRKEIDSWTFPWAGKSGPAMTHRGGYNCRHHWVPVRPEWDTPADEEDSKPMTSVGRMGKCIQRVRSSEGE